MIPDDCYLESMMVRFTNTEYEVHETICVNVDCYPAMSSSSGPELSSSFHLTVIIGLHIMQCLSLSLLPFLASLFNLLTEILHICYITATSRPATIAKELNTAATDGSARA